MKTTVYNVQPTIKAFISSKVQRLGQFPIVNTSHNLFLQKPKPLPSGWFCLELPVCFHSYRGHSEAHEFAVHPQGRAHQSFSPGKCLCHGGTLRRVAAPTPPKVTSLVPGTWRNVNQSHCDSNLLEWEGYGRYSQLCILPSLQNTKSWNGLKRVLRIISFPSVSKACLGLGHF